jgi:Rrf2 family protein
MSKVVAISEAASIALHGMILIARSKPSINVLQIAEKTGASRHHVAKIMQRLAKNNYLTSQRGPTGGFTLKKKPGDITFLEVYETIEGNIEITSCPLDKQICPFEKCIMNNVTNQMTLQFRDHLKKQTLDQYI